MASTRKRRRDSKTYENKSAFNTHEVLAIVRGSFRALKVSQAGGWDVSAYTSRIGDIKVAAKAKSIRRASDPARSPSWHYSIDIALPRTKMSKPEVNALACKVMAAIDRSARGAADSVVWWQQDARWSNDMEVQLQPVKSKLTIDERVQQREDHARKMLARAERDAARAQARIDRWQAKVKYYDNKEAKR